MSDIVSYDTFANFEKAKSEVLSRVKKQEFVISTKSIKKLFFRGDF